jgi:hypothetical protein
MQVRFGTEIENIAQNYIGDSDPMDHVEHFRDRWNLMPKEEWIHKLIHTLDTISKHWYLELEMHRETTNWDELNQRFKVTFTFEHEYPSTDAELKAI